MLALGTGGFGGGSSNLSMSADDNVLDSNCTFEPLLLKVLFGLL